MRRVEKRCCVTALSRMFVVAMAVGVAGCSQVSRFDDPLTSPYARGPSQSTGALAPAPAVPEGHVEAQPLPAQTASPLPPPPGPGAPTYYTPHAPETTGTTSALAPRTAARESEHEGHTIRVTVNPGDTVDGIARRYGTSASAIMRANHITAQASIRPGQQLIVPTHSAAVARAIPATRIATPAPPPAPATRIAMPARPAPASVHPRPVAEAHPPDASGTAAASENVHVVRSGETLSSIAHRVHKSRAALAKANNIDPEAKLSIGQQIVIPGSKVAAAKAGPASASASEGQAAAHAAATPGGKAAVTGSIVATASGSPAGQKTSSAGAGETAHLVSTSSETTQTAAAAASSEPKLRWPVHGRIVCGFGCKTNGQQNDGINVAVPEGTPIKAADDGVVAYAGNELKGYGNLVLVRHSNGFVTAYANASELTVKRGDPIKRGQVIGRSGQTGSASSPQLHFEVRKGSTPVDPTQYLSAI